MQKIKVLSLTTEYRANFLGIFVAVNFLSQVIFIFFFVLTSLAYITIPKNKRKTKITWNKKLTTTYSLGWLGDPVVPTDEALSH